MKKKANDDAYEMKAEYDFRGGVRGKYADRFPPGSVVVELDRDVSDVFDNAASVNAALRRQVSGASFELPKRVGPVELTPAGEPFVKAVLIVPDLANQFPDAKSVNEALRTLIRKHKKSAKKKSR